MTESPPLSRTGRSAMDVALEAARAAGKILIDRWLTDKEISFKGRADIVTDVDLAAEKAILALLRDEYPDFGILAEESEPIRTDSPYTWVVDPLDGTRNYANGVPHFCTVVGLAHGDDVVVGVTYDPAREEMFTAEAGKGAFMNGMPISVTEAQEMSQSLLSFDLGYVDEKAGLALDMVRGLWPNIQSMRLMGSAALGIAYAAAGRVDLYFHHSLSPWDMAAGLVLVREAGGDMVDRQGNPASLSTPSIIASSRHLIGRFLQATEGAEWRK